MPDALLAKIRGSLVDKEPTQRGLRLAGVAMILRNEARPEVLLIKRAERTGDPWSGQIAFPGGKMQPDDRTLKDAAIRETLEEVGIDLNKAADFLGYGMLTTTHTGTMDVIPTVFMMKEEAEARTNEEVASYRWVELEDLLSPKATTSYHLNTPGGALELPAYAVGDYVVWGLTYRILNSLLGYE
jgi:8-oxo-dGTP pyrophosphatase MutT (NUDIX family)